MTHPKTFNSKLFDTVDFQSTIHADRSKRLSVVAETYTHSKSCVIVERLKGLPLFAEVNANVSTSDSQISAALVEAQIFNFVTLV